MKHHRSIDEHIVLIVPHTWEIIKLHLRHERAWEKTHRERHTGKELLGHGGSWKVKNKPTEKTFSFTLFSIAL